MRLVKRRSQEYFNPLMKKQANDKTEKNRNGSRLCAPIGGNGDGPGPGGGLCSGPKRHREPRQAGRQPRQAGSEPGRQTGVQGGRSVKTKSGSQLTTCSYVRCKAGELVAYRARASAVRRLLRRSAACGRQICRVGHNAHVARNLSNLLLGCTVSFELGQALGIDRCIAAAEHTGTRQAVQTATARAQRKVATVLQYSCR